MPYSTIVRRYYGSAHPEARTIEAFYTEYSHAYNERLNAFRVLTTQNGDRDVTSAFYGGIPRSPQADLQIDADNVLELQAQLIENEFEPGAIKQILLFARNAAGPDPK